MVKEVKKNSVWTKQENILKKIQLSFKFIPEVDQLLRIEAAKRGINPSDLIREILGIEYAKGKRPRMGVSFSINELDQLAIELGIEPGDKSELVRRVTETIHLLYRDEIKNWD